MQRTAIGLIWIILVIGGAPVQGKADEQSPINHEAHSVAHAMAGNDHEMAMHTMMFGPLDISYARWASGTAWQPEASPMYAVHLMPGAGWRLMVHWNVFAGYDVQGGARGDRMFTSTNWVMGMARHDLAGGELSVRVMLSAEPATATERGYPLLLQSGEDVAGQPLHDRQHPHDLFMELAALYERPISADLAVLAYVAPSGEPALGPPAFPHRASAFFDPLAPITHHWLDSTHISFGVITAGVFTRRWKLDASWFNGREPDEHRYDLDLRRPDSGSGRLTFNPSDSWSIQASYGYLASPEAVEPSQSVHRVTASIVYDRPVFSAGNVAAMVAWGRNIRAGHPSSDGVLVEGAVDFDGHSVVFGRGEYVRKSALDLAVSPETDDVQFDVGTIALGYLYDFAPVGPLVFGVGARGAIGFVPADLASLYGGRAPVGGMVFLHFRPPRMGMRTNR